MSDTKIIGDLGESVVCDYLKRKGYKIIKRNYRVAGGEIDIIAEKKDFIVFVEVKTRKKCLDAIESVTETKKGFIIRTAQRYMYDNSVMLQPRFDVACVVAKNGCIEAIDYLENAF